MMEIRITASSVGYALRLHVQDAEVFKGLVGALKRQVPPFARRFDRYEKCWHVKAEATADLKAWLDGATRRYKVEVVWERPEGEGGLASFLGSV
ncbi:MAG: hypothetical protein LC802_12535 [Acidobacteria bacterium]|nr:hypothetical protein [Acidobacteriota bacterium]